MEGIVECFSFAVTLKHENEVIYISKLEHGGIISQTYTIFSDSRLTNTLPSSTCYQMGESLQLHTTHLKDKRYTVSM